MTWNYRVLFRKHSNGNHYYQVIEVYYDPDDNISNWSGPCGPIIDEESEEVEQELRYMLDAFLRPPLVEVMEDGKIRLKEISQTEEERFQRAFPRMVNKLHPSNDHLATLFDVSVASVKRWRNGITVPRRVVRTYVMDMLASMIRKQDKK